MTDIQNLPRNDDTMVRRRPQLLIDQIRAMDHDEEQQLLASKILDENKALAKQFYQKDDYPPWWDEGAKWTAPLYAALDDYPCVKRNLADLPRQRVQVAHVLASRHHRLQKKERRLKREYKRFYDEWKTKNLALDRLRDQERKRYTSSTSTTTTTSTSSYRSRRGPSVSAPATDEPDETVDGAIFSNDNALRFGQDGMGGGAGGGGGGGGGMATPYGSGGGAWTSDVVRSDAELLEIIQSLENAEARNPELRAAKTAAVIPPMLLDAKERALTYDDSSGLVEDPLVYYHTGADTEDVWTSKK
ncbi:hypothetical protein BC940DRAFT_337369 [Gongronella butleri]|nr:hypothetical protein BC940DRAFT_337369 [Gongronella butleri]